VPLTTLLRFDPLPTARQGPALLAARAALQAALQAASQAAVAAGSTATGSAAAGSTAGEAAVGAAAAVDTRRDPATSLRLKGHWAEVGLRRLEQGNPGQFSYNVFCVSDADLARLRALHRQYFQQLRAIVAESQPGERVVVANVQLFALDAG
jgi:hypothetical protein